jgi:thiol-disulfide isomerase/thioredoxin
VIRSNESAGAATRPGRRHLRAVALLVLVLAFAFAGAGTAGATERAVLAGSEDVEWTTVADDGSARVHLYFFWSSTCPHCMKAKPFIESLTRKYDWLELHSYPADRASQELVKTADRLEQAVGEPIQGVPAFFFDNKLVTGYGGDSTTGAEIEQGLLDTKSRAEGVNGDAGAVTTDKAEGETVNVPVFGDISSSQVSLPVFTLVLGLLDAFNPCAFFVLLFLLSLLAHARSRSRMATIGGLFVVISGVVYFVFMAAWLNIFLLVGPLRVVTVIAGIVAIVMALINVKDFFWFKRGVSLTMPDEAKPRLFARMRTLTRASSFPAIILGTVTLAIAANSYELLCTAGFPMVFTRVLTLNDASTATYYLYLALYNVIYVLPLAAIVAVFVRRFGTRKLTEREGRVLKLLSGTMMLGMGTVLVAAPDLLNNMGTAILLLVGAILATTVITVIERRYRHCETANAT